jgi:hypothetical protein
MFLKEKGFATRWLRTVIALAEDPSSTPNTHMAAHNYQYLLFQAVQYPLLSSQTTDTHVAHIYTFRQNSHTHKNKMNKRINDYLFIISKLFWYLMVFNTEDFFSVLVVNDSISNHISLNRTGVHVLTGVWQLMLLHTLVPRSCQCISCTVEKSLLFWWWVKDFEMSCLS